MPAAGVFTTNLACAAPVQVSREHLANGHAAAVVLSSGNANAATGERGRTDARRMTELTGAGLGVAADDVLVCSTGLIGYSLPMAPLESGIPALCADLNGSAAAADAILTTDTVRKEAVAEVLGTAGLVGGMAKGAAMLSPAMATMLAVVTTDVRIDPTTLAEALLAATTDTFGGLIVDGSMSTNDTVLVLANGKSDVDAVEHVVGVHRRAHRGLRLARRADGTRRRGRHEARPPARGRRRARTRTPGAPPARWPGRSSCSARSTARTPTGVASSPSSARAGRSSIPSG